MQIRSTTQAHAEIFATYRYPEPYGLHDSAPDSARVFADPRARYYSVLSGETLLGLCCFGSEARVTGASFGDDEPRVLDLGVGMRPDHTGQGQGGEFLASVIEFARTEFAPECLRATIALFNRRSQRLFEKAGFERIEFFERPWDDVPFLAYERNLGD